MRSLLAKCDAECREVHYWIAAKPGVAFIDVGHVGFDSDSAFRHRTVRTEKAAETPVLQ